MPSTTIVLIASLGYIINLVQSISQDKQLHKENGWALIFKCLILGFVPFLLTLTFFSLLELGNFKVSSLAGSHDAQSDFISPLFIVISITVAILFGYIISGKSFLDRLDFFYKELKADSKPYEPEGLIYKFFLNNVSNQGAEGSVIHVTLKTRKTYIAILEHADMNINLAASEMSFSITPLLSGYRKDDDLSVIYTAKYDDQVKTFKNKLVSSQSGE